MNAYNVNFSTIIGDFMVSAAYRMGWGRKAKVRTEEEVLADIEKLRVTSAERIDMAMLDRRAYCLTNSITATEGALPIITKQLEALEAMPEELKKDAYWVLNHALCKERLSAEIIQLEAEKKEVADITELLKKYDFETGRKKFDDELAELKEAAAEEPIQDDDEINKGWEDGHKEIADKLSKELEGSADAVALRTVEVEVTKKEE